MTKTAAEEKQIRRKLKDAQSFLESTDWNAIEGLLKGFNEHNTDVVQYGSLILGKC